MPEEDKGHNEEDELKVARHSKLSIILVLLCLWGIVFVWGVLMYRDHIENSSQSLIQMNVAIETQTRHQLRLIQMILMAIDGWLTQHPESTVIDEDFFDSFVHAGTFRKESGLFLDIYAVDSRGDIYGLASPEHKGALANVSLRKYFNAPLSSKETDILIFPPAIGSISGDLVIPVVLPLSFPRNGVSMLLVAIKVDILDNLYKQQRKPNTRIALVRNDGILLTISHLEKELLGKNYSKSLEKLIQYQEYLPVFAKTTPIDKGPRLVSYVSLKEFPIMVVVSDDYYEILKNFWKNFAVLIALAVIGTVAILLTGRQHMRLLVEQAKLHAKVSHMATTDDLTGIWNRRYFIEFMNQEFERSRRYNNSLSLLMFDLDKFKDINDNHGHQLGDKILVAFANAVLKNLRSVDFFARFGGEEFVVLLPQTSIEMAKCLAERICKIIHQLRILTKHGEISFSTSVGVAALQSTDSKPEEIIHRADKSLYHAKTSGRNQVGTLE